MLEKVVPVQGDILDIRRLWRVAVCVRRSELHFVGLTLGISNVVRLIGKLQRLRNGRER